ncbi:ABC transporter substrate-binding protein [Bacillaceae bacterium SIJ1]|uniref:ABC transporter substrate-binding protein n=1 Tax=Litoribacterium kuwaitense TaxID=1398745 RepID=UPI0013EBF2BD|nr:ABC transporter substrate-binding protein [Litoribacterium kuwaitense]NGP46263.1 ABC transporter substrate-binding protein [Litoribacterium kuwaitense]
MKKHHILQVGWLALLLLLAACTDAPSDQSSNDTAGNKEATPTSDNTDLTEVTVMLDWLPNTNHTGLYVAQANGYYEEQGLKITIQQPGEGNTSDQMVAAGQAEFGISNQENVTMARTNDIPVVSIAAVIQNNTSSFAFLEDSGIETVNDFEGKRYGGWGSASEEATIQAVMENAGADFNELELITLGATDFVKAIGRDADIMWLFDGWDKIAAELAGKKINTISLRELDPALNYYTPVIIANESLLSDQPELAEAFMEATSKGYQDAIEQPEQAANTLLEAVPELDEDLVQESQQYLSSQFQADSEQWGLQKTEVWAAYADWMAERSLIEAELNVEEAFTNGFLPDPSS